MKFNLGLVSHLPKNTIDDFGDHAPLRKGLVSKWLVVVPGDQPDGLMGINGLKQKIQQKQEYKNSSSHDKLDLTIYHRATLKQSYI